MMSKPTSSSCVRPLALTVRGRPEQGDAAAGQDAFLEGRAGGVQGVLDAGLLLLHLALGRGADVDLGHAAGQLGEPLLELLAVVVALGVGDLAADRLDPALDRVVAAGALDDRRVVLVDHDLLGPAQVAQADVLELDAQVLEDRLAAGQDGDVFEHGLAAVAVAGGLDRGAAEGAAQLVDDQGGQGLALDVLGDDQERLARSGRPSRAPAPGP